MAEMIVSVVQADSSIDMDDPGSSIQRNVLRIREAVLSAAAEGAGLVVFGEGYLNGYQTGENLSKVALHTGDLDAILNPVQSAVDDTGVCAAFGATTTRGTLPGSLYNSAIVMRPLCDAIVVNKCHLSEFRDKGRQVAAEKMDWAVGDSLGPVMGIGGFNVAIEICHDIVFPEVARTHALGGAEVIVNLSAAVHGFGWFWDALPVTRALENALWYVHATVVSDSGEPELRGHSRVVDPTGRVVARLNDGEESTIHVAIDRASVASARASLKPFTERRSEIYRLDG